MESQRYLHYVRVDNPDYVRVRDTYIMLESEINGESEILTLC